jgi:hypothetical protein
MDEENKKPSISDKIKLGLVKRIKNPGMQKKIIDSITDANIRMGAIIKSDDTVKLFYLNKSQWFELDEEYIIESIKDDNIKLEAMNNFREHIKNNLKEDGQYAIDSQIDFMESCIIPTITDDMVKFKCIDRIKDEGDVFGRKAEIILSISDEEIRFKCIDKLSNDSEKYRIICTLNDKLKSESISKINNQMLKVGIIGDINDKKIKLDILDKVDVETIKSARAKGIFNLEFLSNNLDMITKVISKEYNGEIENSQLEKIISLTKNMGLRNNEVFQTINFGLLDGKYIQYLGQDKFDVIACYPKIQDKLLNLNEKQYEVFKYSLDTYMKKENQSEWQVVADKLLNSISSGTYDKLIDNISQLDESKIPVDIVNVLSNEINYFNIQSSDDIDNIEQIQQNVYSLIKNNDEEELKKYSQIYEMSKLDRKKFLLFQKVYGQDLSVVQNLIKKYGQDIDSIEYSDKDIDLKHYIDSLKALMELNEEEKLDMLINDGDIGNVKVNPIAVEKRLKTVFARQFNDGLLKSDDTEEINEPSLQGYDVRDAGTDFKMMVTSVAPYYKNSPENYYEDWNRNTLSSQGFCCSYIRNDMFGTAPVPHFCYGFDQMEESSLLASGARDMYSNTNKLNLDVKHAEKYYSPDNQISETSLGNGLGNRYNEMVYRRSQNNQRKQPSYIVLFKSNGEIKEQSIEDVKKAVDSYKVAGIELPIVIIDKDKCVKSEKAKLDSMIAEYKTNLDPGILNKIHRKITNNSKCNDFRDYELILESLEKTNNTLKDIQSSRSNEKDKARDIVGIDEYRENYDNVVSVEKDSSELETVAINVNRKVKEAEDFVI